MRVPYETQVDPYSDPRPSGRPSQFGQDWQILWETRSRPEFQAKIPTSIGVETFEESAKRDRVRIVEYEQTFPSEPWVDTFLLCWMTEADVNLWAPHPDWSFLQALVVEYRDVIRKLRNGTDPPWDPGLLIYGTPL